MTTFFPQTPEGLFLKSNFEFLRQNFRKSIKLLNSAPKPNDLTDRGQSVSTMYYNNLGCIHFQMHKYNLAALYFRKSLQENNKALSVLPPVDKSMFIFPCLFPCYKSGRSGFYGNRIYCCSVNSSVTFLCQSKSGIHSLVFL